jgi:hypothetical protein
MKASVTTYAIIRFQELFSFLVAEQRRAEGPPSRELIGPRTPTRRRNNRLPIGRGPTRFNAPGTFLDGEFAQTFYMKRSCTIDRQLPFVALIAKASR